MKYLNKKAKREKVAQKHYQMTIYEKFAVERDSDYLLNE